MELNRQSRSLAPSGRGASLGPGRRLLPLGAEGTGTLGIQNGLALGMTDMEVF